MKMIDFRSDTVTEPTQAMKAAMMDALLGDDVYDDDPTTNGLQQLAADMTGKEAALFVPSGTFGNQLCLFTHAERGNEVILDDSSHIIWHEAGGGAVIAGVQFRTFDTPGGKIDIQEIRRRIRVGDDIHYPKTALICLENARGDGRVLSFETMAEVKKLADEYGLPVHIDGARIFNAVTYLNRDIKEISGLYDTMSICLSKGLCAPIGSIVVGSREFIAKAKKKRKIMGGGMRQTGILAAAGIIALRDMTKRLGDDHANALYMAERLRSLPRLEVCADSDININMVFFKMDADSKALEAEMLKHGIKINPAEDGQMRFVTHYWITREHINFAIEKMREFLA